MTSKQALERLKTHVILLEERIGIDNTSPNPYAQDYNTIKEALEVLELFNHWCPSQNHLEEIRMSKDYDDYMKTLDRYFILRSDIMKYEPAYNEEDYNKIKCWLEAR